MIVQKCHCYFRLQWGTCWSFALQTGDRVQEFTENENAFTFNFIFYKSQ